MPRVKGLALWEASGLTSGPHGVGLRAPKAGPGAALQARSGLCLCALRTVSSRNKEPVLGGKSVRLRTLRVTTPDAFATGREGTPTEERKKPLSHGSVSPATLYDGKLCRTAELVWRRSPTSQMYHLFRYIILAQVPSICPHRLVSQQQKRLQLSDKTWESLKKLTP